MNDMRSNEKELKFESMIANLFFAGRITEFEKDNWKNPYKEKSK